MTVEDSRPTLPGSAPVPPALEARYEILGPLGVGATAIVWRARDRELGRPVALKILKSELCEFEQLRLRFVREARIAAGLSHANLVAVYDAGEADGRPFIAMELVEGRPLSELIGEPMRDLRRLGRIVAKAARAIGAAHARGVVHRDLKPANILVAAGDEPKVSDFGLAHFEDSKTADLTRTGTALGTPLYMAPEQVRDSKTISASADVHALGAVLFEIATGRPPYLGMSIGEIYAAIMNDPPPMPHVLSPATSPDLETIILHALEKRPGDRYIDGLELADDLDRWLAGKPVAARRSRVATIAIRVFRRKRPILVTAVVTLCLAALVGIVPLVGAIRGQNEAIERARVRNAAYLELDNLRTVLDKAALVVYSKDGDYESLVRTSEELRPRIESCIARAPDLSLGHTLLGRTWEFQGWLEKAEAEWRRAIALDPDAAAPRIALARLLLETSYLASLTFLEIRRGGPRPMVSGDAERQIQGAIEAISRGKGVDAVQLDVAKAMLAEIRQDQAAALQLATEGVARHGRATGVEDLYWLRGTLTQGTESIDALTKAIELRPKTAIYLFSRAGAWDAMGRTDRAEQDYAAAIALRPRFFEARLNRGATLTLLGRPDEARREFDEALRLRPASTSRRFNRGLLLAKLQEYDAALADFDAVVAAEPGNAGAWFERGNIYSKLGKHASALEQADAAIACDRTYVNAWLLKGRLLMEKERFADAVETYSKGMASAGERTPMLLYERACALAAKGTTLSGAARNEAFEQSFYDFQGYLKMEPRDWEGRFNFGRLLTVLGRRRESIEQLELVVQHAPVDSNLWRAAKEMVDRLRQ